MISVVKGDIDNEVVLKSDASFFNRAILFSKTFRFPSPSQENSSSMTLATIGLVQMPVLIPYATGPLSNMWASFSRWSLVIAGGRSHHSFHPGLLPASQPNGDLGTMNRKELALPSMLRAIA